MISQASLKDEGRAEGEAKGRAEGKKDLPIKLLEQRFGPLTVNQREQIEAVDPEVLADKVLSAESLSELRES